MIEKNSSGAIALAAILSITLIVSVFGIALGLAATFEGWIGLAALRAHEAHLAAQSGAYDGLWRLARNRNHSASYSFLVGRGSASVSFSRTGVPAQHVNVTSIGEVHGNMRRVDVLVFIDAHTGEARIISWREVTI